MNEPSCERQVALPEWAGELDFSRTICVRSCCLPFLSSTTLIRMPLFGLSRMLPFGQACRPQQPLLSLTTLAGLHLFVGVDADLAGRWRHKLAGTNWPTSTQTGKLKKTTKQIAVDSVEELWHAINGHVCVLCQPVDCRLFRRHPKAAAAAGASVEAQQNKPAIRKRSQPTQLSFQCHGNASKAQQHDS